MQRSAEDGLGADDSRPSRGSPTDRLGTKKDVEDQLALMARRLRRGQEVAAREGKCWEPASRRRVKLREYESWPGYQAGLPLVVRRYCGLWGRGT